MLSLEETVGRTINHYHRLHLSGLTMYCGRGTPFGNPYIKGADGTSEEVCAKYKIWFYEQLDSNLEFRKHVFHLVRAASKDDLNLMCSCKPRRCHTDTIEEFINAALISDLTAKEEAFKLIDVDAKYFRYFKK